MTDPELVRRMAEGDEEAFVTLYRRWQGGVYRFALHMSGSAETAEEVTQEVFLALIRQPHRYDPAQGSVAAYLYGTARHHVLRWLERQHALVAMEDEASEGLPSAEDPLADLTRAERLEMLRRAVLSLPESYREVVVLCDLHEMDYEGAAAILECPVGTVRSRLHRGRALLAEKLRSLPARCVI
jgi:RNA polymerase sigma-70 factor (ECF subfamily)